MIDDDSLHLDGISGGVFAGKNFALNPNSRLVGSLEGAVAADSANGSVGAGATQINAASRYSCELAGRVGYGAGQNTLLYGRLGCARTKQDASGQDLTFDGVRYGGGLKHQIGKSTSLRAKYTRADYESKQVAAGRIEPHQNAHSLGLALHSRTLCRRNSDAT